MGARLKPPRYSASPRELRASGSASPWPSTGASRPAEASTWPPSQRSRRKGPVTWARSAGLAPRPRPGPMTWAFVLERVTGIGPALSAWELYGAAWRSPADWLTCRSANILTVRYRDCPRCPLLLQKRGRLQTSGVNPVTCADVRAAAVWARIGHDRLGLGAARVLTASTMAAVLAAVEAERE